MKRYFEFIGADSSRASGKAEKFWEISLSKTEITIRFGKIGANGQTTLKSFPDTAAASREVEKLVNEKVKKGYLEVVSQPKSTATVPVSKPSGASKSCVACSEEILDTAKLCKHCGTLQNDPRFTSDTQNVLPESSKEHQPGNTDTATTTSEKLIAHFSTQAANWLLEFGIDPEPIDGKAAKKLSAADKGRVWSAMADWVGASVTIDGQEINYRYGFPLVPGYEPDCDDYLLGAKPSDQVNGSIAFLELRIPCDECNGDGADEDGDDCTECDGEAEKIYDLDFQTGRYS